MGLNLGFGFGEGFMKKAQVSIKVGEKEGERKEPQQWVQQAQTRKRKHTEYEGQGARRVRQEVGVVDWIKDF